MLPEDMRTPPRIPDPIWNRLNINTANAYQQTTTAWAQARAKIAMEDAADQHNANLVTDYQSQWARYKQDRDNQPAATNFFPPYPATAQSVDVMINGWPETVDSTALVCSPNVYQPPKFIADTHGMAFAGSTQGVNLDIFAGVNLGGIVTRPDTTKWVRIG